MVWSLMNKMTVKTWAHRAERRLQTGDYPMRVRCSRNPSSEKPVPGVYDFSLGSTSVHSVAGMKIEMAWHTCQ